MTRARFEFRRRTRPTEGIHELHKRLMSCLSELPAHWWKTDRPIGEPDLQEGLEAQIDLGPGLADDLTGYVSYVYRSPSYTGQTAEFDDRLILAGDLAKNRYELLVAELFPSLVEGFQPYRAGVVLDEDLALDDWDLAVELGRKSGSDLDGRDGVMRIQPVCYYDRELCVRAFGLSPEEMYERLKGRPGVAKVLHDGVELIVTNEMVGRESLLQIDSEIRELLTPDRSRNA